MLPRPKWTSFFLRFVFLGWLLPFSLIGAGLEKQDLFVAGENGCASYRIPAVVVTPQQAVLVACEARRDNRSDWGHIDLFVRRSIDGGRTWEKSRQLIGREDLPADLAQNAAHASGEGKFTINNPTWISNDATGETHLLFCAEYARGFMITTRDGGATFSAPREITAAFQTFRSRDSYPWKVIAIGPGHGTRLASGRLVAAVWLATGEGGNAHRPSICATIYSDDRGITWHAGEVVARDPDPLRNPSETAVVEIAPGQVMLNIRSDSPNNRRAIAIGRDGATRWSQPSFDEALWEPVCMASPIRYDPSGSPHPAFLLFSNPASLEKNPKTPAQSASRIRQDLTLRASRDGGKTWPIQRLLQAGASAYSDLAVTADGHILCFYERGEKDPYEKLTLARFPSAWLLSDPR